MTGIGSADLKRHLAGEDLTPLQAIKAKCADCTGNYTDGRVSCDLKECPLFPYHAYNPYRKKTRIGRPGRGGPGRFARKPLVEPILEEVEA